MHVGSYVNEGRPRAKVCIEHVCVCIHKPILMYICAHMCSCLHPCPHQYADVNKPVFMYTLAVRFVELNACLCSCIYTGCMVC